MSKEELDRIKEAYYSGLKVQIWFDGHWENFDVREYSMYPDPFSENRMYRIVGSEYADMAEKRIKDLEKENAELKAVERMALYSKMSDQLTKAKKLLKQFLEAKNGEDTYKAEWETEQFLKEIEK